MYGAGAARRLLAAGLEGVAPTRCAGCGQGGSPLCEDCAAAVEATPQPLLGGLRAAFVYSDEVRNVLHGGKFRDCRRALRALSWLGAARLRPPTGAVVTPIPLGRRRSAERGYNQAALIATALADFHRLPLVPLLERTRDTSAQSILHRGARLANVAGAFRASPAAANVDVWLVDDVLTTGATCRAAQQALLEAGAARVEIAVLAAVL
ncbi:MAG: ComF family protein [Candidatus Dormibacteria bacterium]